MAASVGLGLGAEMHAYGLNSVTGEHLSRHPLPLPFESVYYTPFLRPCPLATPRDTPSGTSSWRTPTAGTCRSDLCAQLVVVLVVVVVLLLLVFLLLLLLPLLPLPLLLLLLL